MKLLGAEEEYLAEGERHVMGDLREGEGGRIAAEEAARTLRDLDAAHDHFGYSRHDSNHRILHILFPIPFKRLHSLKRRFSSQSAGSSNKHNERLSKFHRKPPTHSRLL